MLKFRNVIRLFVYIVLLVGCSLAATTTTTTTQPTTTTTTAADTTTNMATTPEVTTVAPPNCGSEVECFFADDHNKAMYLVLPCIVIVYGGCGVIYCCSRIRRYFRREKRRKQREMMGSRNDGFVDVDAPPPPRPQPFRSGPPPTNPSYPKPTAPYYNPGQQNWKAEDCLAMEVSEIDNQLKQAFAMIDDVTKDIKNKRSFDSRSKPDIGRQQGENDIEISRKRKYKYKHFSSAA